MKSWANRLSGKSWVILARLSADPMAGERRGIFYHPTVLPDTASHFVVAGSTYDDHNWSTCLTGKVLERC